MRQQLQPGDPVDAIDTPSLVIDLDAMDRNLRRMAAFALAHGVRLRPHAKMHKCAAIAKRQIEAGAVGVCVQKLGEAEILAAAGITDIFISNEIVAPSKLERVAALARTVRLALAVDSEQGIERLAQAMRAGSAEIDVFVEVDVGQGRCGAAPQEAGTLAALVGRNRAAGLYFAGLQAYHGGAQHVRLPAEREEVARQAIALARVARASVEAAGLACPLVTGAGTGTFMHEAASGVYGEIQPGSYLFMDRDYADNQPDPREAAFEHALFVKSQVISLSGATHAVVDAGHKSHAIDSGLPRVAGRELDFANGGDEHGILRARPGASLPVLGETVWLVPGHCDPTVNLHDQLVAVRGGLQRGQIEAVWTVDARGALT